MAIKDLFDVAGVATTAGSRAVAGNVAAEDADAVGRLVCAGAVIVGKANMDQFAFGPHQADYGRTNLPAEQPTMRAGRAAGRPPRSRRASCRPRSAATRAARRASRRRAAGSSSIKPTFGRVPARGAAPTFWSLDHVAPIAGTVAGVGALLAVLADAWAPAPPAGAPRLAVLAGWDDGCDDAVSGAIARALARAEAAGAELRHDRAVAGLENWSDMLMATVGPEAAVALAPYPRDAMPAPLLEILDAGRALSAADYVSAQRDRAALREALEAALADVDALVLPTSLTVAWRWADLDAGDMGVRNIATKHLPPANLTGHPAISLPAPSDGLPVGLQLIGRLGADEALLETAAWVEAALA